jgi:hypothetical protein
MPEAVLSLLTVAFTAGLSQGSAWGVLFLVLVSGAFRATDTHSGDTISMFLAAGAVVLAIAVFVLCASNGFP